MFIGSGSSLKVGTSTRVQIDYTDKSATHKAITYFLSSNDKNEVEFGKNLILHLIKHVGGFYDKNIFSSDLAYFEPVIKEYGEQICTLDAMCLYIFCSNRYGFATIPKTLKNLLQGLEPDGKAKLSEKVRSRINDAIRHLLREGQVIEGQDNIEIKKFLDNNDIDVNYNNDSNIEFKKNDINELNNQFIPKNQSNSLKLQLVPYNEFTVNKYCKVFEKKFKGTSLKSFLAEHPIVVFGNKELENFDKNSIIPLHCNEAQDYEQKLKAKKHSVIIQPAVNKTGQICHLISIPPIIADNINSDTAACKELLKERFKLIFNSAIAMECKTLVVTTSAIYHDEVVNENRHLILSIFLETLKEIKQNTIGFPYIYFLTTQNELELLNKIFEYNASSDFNASFQNTCSEAASKIIDYITLTEIINDTAITEGRWFILNPSSMTQNGGDFINYSVKENEHRSLEESIFTNLIVPPYDVVYKICQENIYYVNTDAEYNTMNDILLNIISKYVDKNYYCSKPSGENLHIAENFDQKDILIFERDIIKLYRIYDEMNHTPYTSFVKLNITINHIQLLINIATNIKSILTNKFKTSTIWHTKINNIEQNLRNLLNKIKHKNSQYFIDYFFSENNPAIKDANTYKKALAEISKNVKGFYEKHKIILENDPDFNLAFESWLNDNFDPNLYKGYFQDGSHNSLDPEFQESQAFFSFILIKFGFKPVTEIFNTQGESTESETTSTSIYTSDSKEDSREFKNNTPSTTEQESQAERTWRFNQVRYRTINPTTQINIKIPENFKQFLAVGIYITERNYMRVLRDLDNLLSNTQYVKSVQALNTVGFKEWIDEFLNPKFFSEALKSYDNNSASTLFNRIIQAFQR